VAGPATSAAPVTVADLSYEAPPQPLAVVVGAGAVAVAGPGSVAISVASAVAGAVVVADLVPEPAPPMDTCCLPRVCGEVTTSRPCDGIRAGAEQYQQPGQIGTHSHGSSSHASEAATVASMTDVTFRRVIVAGGLTRDPAPGPLTARPTTPRVDSGQ